MDNNKDLRQRRIDALAGTRLFHHAPEADLADLVSTCREVHLDTGELLFSAGDPSHGLFLVLSGRTKAVRHGADGREQIIHEDSPGSTFPEVAVFDDGPYPSSVLAAEPSSLLFVPKAEVRKFCLRNPAVALEALSILAARLRRATGLAENLALKGVDQRLAGFLVAQSRANRSTVYQLGHSNQEIADLIGTVREVVSRSFSRLQQKGWIRKAGRRIEILKADALDTFSTG